MVSRVALFELRTASVRRGRGGTGSPRPRFHPSEAENAEWRISYKKSGGFPTPPMDDLRWHPLNAPLTWPAMRPDPTFKNIFSYPFMAAELVRWLVAELHGASELVDALDFERMERVHEQSTAGPADGKRSYASDIVWRIPFRPGRGGGWTHLILMVEPQSRVDYLMALRTRNYADGHHMELWRGKRFGARDRLDPVLPVVFYTGALRWTAASRVLDLVTPGADAEPPSPSSRTEGLFAGDGYLAVDTLRLGADDIPHSNAAALLAGMCNPAPKRLPEQAAALRDRLSAPEFRELLEVVLRWAQRTAEDLIGFDLGIRGMAEAESYYEPDLLDYFAERRREYQETYREEGRKEGREALRGMAERKFGAAVAERLAPVLAGSGTEGMAAVGDWIIDCATGEELLTRLDSLP